MRSFRILQNASRNVFSAAVRPARSWHGLELLLQLIADEPSSCCARSLARLIPTMGSRGIRFG